MPAVVPATPVAASATPAPDLPRNAFEQEILDAHNKARAEEDRGLSSLKWSAQLQAEAQALADKCTFISSPPAGQGQNLYETRDSIASASSAVDDWMGQQYNYVNKQTVTEGCYPDKDCTHYTQVVWHSTTAVGCATKRCLTDIVDKPETGGGFPGTILVCNYSPAGNIPGQSAFPPK